LTHEFNGDEYQKASLHQKEWGSKIISELNLKGHERILDLGCGDGVLTAQLADRVPQGSVLGIDASQGMIETALKNPKPNLEYVLKDINQMDFDQEFDLIFSNAALHWVLDQPRFLHNVFKSLKMGGTLRFNFAARGNCENFFSVVKKAMEIPQYRRYFLNFTWPWYMPAVEEYRILVNQQPFSEIKVWLENADRHFPDAESLIRWIDQPSLVPFKAVLQPPNRGFFRDLVVQRMLETTQQADGTFFETFNRINVFARK
jgi:trans-aconitate 2-methyltransferase